MYDNPADFALDSLIDAGRKTGELERLDQAYRSSPMHANVVNMIRERSYNDELEKKRRQEKGAAARSLGAEIFYVAQRTLRSAIRNPQLFLAQNMIAITMGLLVGLVFFDLKRTTTPGIQDRLGTLFFIVMNQIFSSLSSLEPLLQERVLFIHVSCLFINTVEERDIFAGEYQWLLSNFYVLRGQTLVRYFTDANFTIHLFFYHCLFHDKFTAYCWSIFHLSGYSIHG